MALALAVRLPPPLHPALPEGVPVLLPVAPAGREAVALAVALPPPPATSTPLLTVGDRVLLTVALLVAVLLGAGGAVAALLAEGAGLSEAVGAAEGAEAAVAVPVALPLAALLLLPLALALALAVTVPLPLPVLLPPGLAVKAALPVARAPGEGLLSRLLLASTVRLLAGEAVWLAV